jgi:hypothetical protein
MSSHVLCQVGALPEGFPTIMALIWFLPSVNAIVSSEGGPSAEGFPTLITLMVVLPCVDSLVAFEVTTSAEDMKTLVTFIGFFSGMNSHMQSEG